MEYVEKMIEVIAELGINANGDLDIAKRMIDIASAAGCKYIKLQKRDIDVVYTVEELSKPRQWKGKTVITREQKEDLEFDFDDYLIIDEYCRMKGIKWFASPWDLNSLNFICQFEIPYIKIPSALITNTGLMKNATQRDIPIIISTGMSDNGIVDKAIETIGKDNIACVMHCTSTYPSRPDELNMKCISRLKEKYPWAKIGYSNHYPGLMGMIMAVALGCDMIEFHFTLDRTMEGSDQAASIEPRGLFELMERINLIEKMQGDGVKKIFESEIPIMSKLRR
jgi:N-acetylneuraminate synthase